MKSLPILIAWSIFLAGSIDHTVTALSSRWFVDVFGLRSNTYWVDSTGSNTNPCSLALPCKTISYVLNNLVEEGDVIKVLPGVYREQLLIEQSGIVLEGDGPGVYVFGAAVPVFSEAENLHVADWNWGASYKGTTFCDNLTNDVELDGDFCNTLGFWQAGVRLEQVLTKSAVVAGTFYYDFDDERLWLLPVAGNSDLGDIEGLTYDYTIKLAPGSQNVTLKNLNIWYGASMPDDGILQIEGAGHLVEDVEVRYSAGAGILVYGADQVVLNNVHTSYHGQNGLRVRAAASFSTSSGWDISDWVDELLLVNSSSRHNGWKGFDNCWGGGGTKFSFTNDLIIDGFYSTDNNGFGIWLDIENHFYVVKESLSARDAGRGIFVEYISDNGTVENNVVFGTRDADEIGCGISVGLAAADSRHVLIKNNTVYSTEEDVKGLMLKTGCSTCRSFPYPSEFISWENNVLINKDDAGFVRDLDAGTTDSFEYTGTYVEEEFSGDGTVLVCWDGLGSCTHEALGVEVLSQGVYLDDETNECGFNATNNLLSEAGVQNFTHPRAGEICGDTIVPIPPVADFSYFVNGFVAEFTDLSTDDGVLTNWSWSFGDGLTSETQSPSHTFDAAGTYAVTLTVTDDAGLTDAVTSEVTIEEIDEPSPPVADYLFDANGLTVDFTDISTDNGEVLAWLWDFGDEDMSEEQHPEHIYSIPGTYVVTLTVTDDEGLSAVVQKTLVVEDVSGELPPVAAFSVEINGLEAAFTDLSTDVDGSVVSWFWDFGDGQSSSVQHPVHSFATTGTYLVTLDITDDSGLKNSSETELQIEMDDSGTGAFLESNGMAVMEAEHFTERFANLETLDAWLVQVASLNDEAVTAMQALDDDGDIVLSNYKTDNAELKFLVQFSNTGVYYVWVRMRATVNGSTVYAGLGEQSMRMGVASQVVPDTSWAWYGTRNEGRRAQFSVLQAGQQSFSIWMREDGLLIDRILLTTNADYIPDGTGPAESPRALTEQGTSPFHEDRVLDSMLSPDALPGRFAVNTSYPNPAFGSITILMDIPEEGVVSGDVFDLLGRKVYAIQPVHVFAQTNAPFKLDASALSAGTYVYKIKLQSHNGIALSNGTFVVSASP